MRPGRELNTTILLDRNTEFIDAVGDEHDRQTAPRKQSEQFVVELGPRDLVERREGFIHQQNFRFGHQCTRDRYPHLHAAGQLPRIGFGKAAQPDLRRALPRPGCGASDFGTPASNSGRWTFSATVRQGNKVGS